MRTLPNTDKRPYVLFSSNDPAGLERDLRALHIPFTKLAGCYKGESEPSYLVDREHWPRARQLARVKDQDSALHIGPRLANGSRPAFLEFLNVAKKGTRAAQWLGWFRSTDKATALRQDAWTRRGAQYYIVTED